MSQDPTLPWIQLFVQTGSLGILAYIVARLVPQLSKEARQEREAKDLLLQRMVDALQMQFAARNQALVEAIARQTGEITDKIERQTDSFMGAMDEAFHLHRHRPPGEK